MGTCFCCASWNRDKITDSLRGLQHGLNDEHKSELINNIIRPMELNTAESSLNTMSVSVSHPIQDDDDMGDLKMPHEDTRYLTVLHRMQRRKNLKSYLTEIKRSKQQCITKKKKLKQLLLDQNNEKEYNTAFDLNKSPNAPKFKQLSPQTVFPEISFTDWIIEKGVTLNHIINDIYSHDIGYIPPQISIICMCYTLDLLPGIYEFVGSMDYNGADDETDVYMNGFGGGNHCTFKIILNSRCEIVGGHFTENSVKYYITNGTYTYNEPYCIEFTKEYFDYNCKYKVYGQITRDKNEHIQFKGHWKLLDGLRGGNVLMDYIKTKQNDKLKAGSYAFYGHCDYLPNTEKRHIFKHRQRMKCCLDLSANKYRIEGVVKLLISSCSELWNEEQDEEHRLYMIDEVESEWDIYGGLHIELHNGYVMEGFFNGEDFLGVWKDSDFERFGHFQCRLCHNVNTS